MPEPEKTRLQLHQEAKQQQERDRAELLEKRRRAEAKVRSAVNHLAATREGSDFLVWLFHLCGYNQASTVVDPVSGDVLERATDHNEARRSVYIDVRKRLDPELRAKIELLAETPFKDETPK